MSNILVPIDFVQASSSALRYSLHFAEALGKEIILLHVIYPEFEMLDLPVVSLQTTREKIELARENMQQLVDQSLMQIQLDQDLESVPILRADIEIGTPGPVIDTVSENDDIDFSIMGMRDDHSVLENWLGSVTQHIVTRSQKPVLVLPRECNFKVPKRILYASNFTEGDLEGIHWIMKNWAPFEAQINILHIHSGSKTISADHYAQHLEVADGLQREFPNITILDKEGDDPVKALLYYIDEGEYDLLALFSPLKSWWERLTHKSIAKQVIKLSEQPVLVLK